MMTDTLVFCRKLGITLAIIIGETQEGAKIARGGGDRPGADGVDFAGVHRDAVV